MSAKYTYSITNDFPNNKVESSKLTNEIEKSNITTSLDYINTNDDDCDIWFSASLSSADATSLTTIITIHNGESLLSRYEAIAGEDIGDRQAVYISGSNEVKLARADSDETLPCVGFAEYAATQGNKILIQSNDILNGFSGLTPGSEYFLSDSTAGMITTLKPVNGKIVTIGVAKTSEEIDIHIFVFPRRSIDLAINNGINEYLPTDTTAYIVARSFYFLGTDNWSPTNFGVITSRGSSETSGEVRIYDVTNSQEVMSVTWSNQQKGFYSTANLSALPSDAAVLELQLRSLIEGNEVRVHYMTLY